jgi:hypothetical protein
MRYSYGLLCLFVACTSRSPDPATSGGAEASTRLVPRWHVGDRWVVRYKGLVDMGAARAESSMAMWEYDWHYSVTAIDDAGVHVGAIITFPKGHTEGATMTFTPDGRLIDADYGMEVEKQDLGGPVYFPLFPQRYHPVAFEWPAFPLTEGIERPDLGDVREKIEHTGNTWRVEMQRSGDWPFDEGWWRENTMEQLWEVDRPWWTSVTVRHRMHKPDRVTDRVDVEGRVTEWHLVE